MPCAWSPEAPEAQDHRVADELARSALELLDCLAGVAVEREGDALRDEPRRVRHRGRVDEVRGAFAPHAIVRIGRLRRQVGDEVDNDLRFCVLGDAQQVGVVVDIADDRSGPEVVEQLHLVARPCQRDDVVSAEVGERCTSEHAARSCNEDPHRGVSKAHARPVPRVPTWLAIRRRRGIRASAARSMSPTSDRAGGSDIRVPGLLAAEASLSRRSGRSSLTSLLQAVLTGHAVDAVPAPTEVGTMTSRAGLVSAADALLLERSDELARIELALAEAREGHGRFVVIEGPAGIGKTALLAEVRTAAADGGMRVLRSRGTELERDFAFGVVRQLFEPPLAQASQLERADLLQAAAGMAAGVLGLPSTHARGKTRPRRPSIPRSRSCTASTG